MMLSFGDLNFDLSVGFRGRIDGFPLGGGSCEAGGEGLYHKDLPLIRRLRRHLPPRGKACVYLTYKPQFVKNTGDAVGIP